MPEDRLLTVGEVAKRLAVGRSTVVALLASGEIASLKIRRARRVQLSRLEGYIAARAQSEARRHEKAVPEIETGTAEEAGHASAPRSG